MIEPQHRSSPMPRLCTALCMRYLFMIVGLVSHGKALALELTAALAVDSQAMRSKGSVDVSPAAPQAQGKHVLAEKAVNFLQATGALTHRTAKP